MGIKPPLDYSQCNDFLTCQEKYNKRYNKCIRKIKEDRIDLSFGKLGHKCLELYYKDRKEGKFNERDIEKYLLPFDSLVEIPNNKVKTQVAGKLAIRKYIETYHLQEKDWEILAVEETYEAEVKGIRYAFKVDLVIEHRGNLYCLDHKLSAKKDRKKFFNGYDLNSQMTGYCYAVMDKFGYCSGFYVNALFVGHRERKYKGEPAGYYCNPERQLFTRYPESFTAFEENVRNIDRKIKDCVRDGIWTRNESNCDWCEFKMLCMAFDDEEIQEQFYQTCNPYEYLESVTGSCQ